AGKSDITTRSTADALSKIREDSAKSDGTEQKRIASDLPETTHSGRATAVAAKPAPMRQMVLAADPRPDDQGRPAASQPAGAHPAASDPVKRAGLELNGKSKSSHEA